MIANRYIAMVDILGFTQLFQNHSLDYVVKLLEHLTHKVSRVEKTWAASFHGRQESDNYLLNFFHFSDTLVCWSPIIQGDNPDRELLMRILFLQSVGEVIFRGFISGIPLRAGIAFGESYINSKKRVFAGQSILDAHVVETLQDWIGGAFHPSCPAIETHSALNSGDPRFPAIQYQVPIKKGADLQLNYALDWLGAAISPWQQQWQKEFGYSPREKFEESLSSYLKGDLSPSVKRKYINSEEFYNHLMEIRSRADMEPLD